MPVSNKEWKGSIPACAGEPDEYLRGALDQMVYPRVCGGTTERLTDLCKGAGLSPRVRGNPTSDFSKGQLRGSIPACAGEPIARANLR